MSNYIASHRHLWEFEQAGVKVRNHANNGTGSIPSHLDQTSLVNYFKSIFFMNKEHYPFSGNNR